LIRGLVSETRLSPEDIILPYFVVEGKGIRRRIRSMPGVYHLSIDNLIKDISQAQGLGISSIILFGLPEKKDNRASWASSSQGIIQKALREIKKNFQDLIVVTDVCLCGYTKHGHCGIINKDQQIDQQATLKVLARIALSHAQAGADFLGPSGMVDGQVGAIRIALDKKGFGQTGIMAYSAKYASNFYGPFREALNSAPQFGDRKAYQLDYRNSSQALTEIEQDINEGADIVMVKPALAYLDVIYQAKQRFDLPIAAYNVSGEYSMVKKLAAGDKAKEKELALETITAIKRSGADLIISYFGKELMQWIS